MARRQTPIITHTEILTRAIRSIDQEIGTWKARCEGIPDAEQMIAEATAGLAEKLAALNELYRIETGTDYE